MPKSSSWCASSCALLYRVPDGSGAGGQPAVGASDEQIAALAVGEEGAQRVDEVAEDAAGVDGELAEEADRHFAAEHAAWSGGPLLLAEGSRRDQPPRGEPRRGGRGRARA